MFKSIRTKLTLWYAFVLVAVLFLFCTVLYFSIHYALNRQINRTLLREAHSIADAYHPELDNFQDLPAHDFQANPLIWFRIVRIDGRLFRPAPSFKIFGHQFPLQAAQKLKSESPLFETFRLSDNKVFRSIIFPIEIGRQRFGWIQLVKPISNTVRTLNLIKMIMLFSVPAAIILLSVGGYFLARKTLKPIDIIRQQVAQIYEQNLTQRIKVINPDDELGLLTRTFNEMLERLQLAFESQRRFLADASHELKTPLAILRSQWEKIIQRKDLPLQLKHLIQTDIEEIARLTRLIDHLLLLSAIDDNRIKIEQQPVDLTNVLQEILEDGKILAQSKKQTIAITRLEPAIITGDRNRLLQLFLNLIDNAVKYTPVGGKINISQYHGNGKIVVKIKDTGIGIPPQDIPRIFDRFFRVDKSRSRQLGGSGLGLSICKWIVTAHRGTIKVNSTPGKGTEVIIEFPS